MDRIGGSESSLLVAATFGVVGTVLVSLSSPPSPAATLSRPLVFLVCSLGALFGLWVVSHAVSLDA